MTDRDPSTIAEDIYALLDDETDHEVSEENIEWAAEVFKNLLRSRLKKRKSVSGEGVLRFSSLGKKDRQLWYAAHMPEKAEKLSGKTMFKFLYGDLIEVLLLFLAKESGHDVQDTQVEVESDGVLGHIDATIDGVLVDVKSASPYSYGKFVTNSYLFDDPFGYVAQLSGYANCLEKERAGFLVCDKVHGDISYVELDKEYIKGNHPTPRIEHLRGVLASSIPPKRCYSDEPEGKSGNRKLGVGCSYCPFKEECWPNLKKYMYSRGPVWLTHVAKEPRVPSTDA